MSKITLTMDGKKVAVDEGVNLLQAARQAGIDIPTLCHNDGLKPQGACRLCLVEVEEKGTKRLVASCAYPVEEGLTVTTSTPRIEKHRKLLLELLWPTCGELAARHGVHESRFKETSDCNLCGLCVRYCSEVAKKHVLYFKGRGINREIAFVPGMASECATCRKCFELCTGGHVVTAQGEAALQVLD